MADPKYYNVVTDVGLALIEDAYNNGTKVNITQMALGDSNGGYVAPDKTFTSLVNEFGREDIHESNHAEYLIYVYVYVSAERAGNTVREFGLYDDLGNLIVYGAYPESLIPDEISSDYIQLEIEVRVDLVNAESVTVTVNPLYPQAKETEAGIAKIINATDVDAGTDDSKFLTIKKLLMRTASDVRAGVVQLSNKLDGEDKTKSATEWALGQLKSAIDNLWAPVDASETVKGIAQIANSEDITSGTNDSKMLTIQKMLMRTATLARAGVVQLSESTSGSSNLKAATEKAVSIAKITADNAQTAANNAQNTADSKWLAKDASTTEKGILMLSHKTDGTDQTKAASEYALGLVEDIAQDALANGGLQYVLVDSGTCDIPLKNSVQGTYSGTITTGLSVAGRRHHTNRFKVTLKTDGPVESSTPSSCYWGGYVVCREFTRWSGTPMLELDVYAYGTGIVSGTFTGYEVWELR